MIKIGLAGLLLAGLELFAWQETASIWMISLWMSFLVLGVVRLGLKEEPTDGSKMILAIASLPALITLTLFLPSGILLHLSFGLMALGFYWILTQDFAARPWLVHSFVTPTILFLDIGLLLIWRMHLTVPMIVFLLLTFLVTGFLSWQAFQRIPEAGFMILPSLILALVLTEVGWLLSFLPVHWVAHAGIIAIAYYVCFHLIMMSRRRALTWREGAEYAAVGGVALLFIISSVQWT